MGETGLEEGKGETNMEEGGLGEMSRGTVGNRGVDEKKKLL